MEKAPVPEDDIALEAARLSGFRPDGEPVQALASSLKETMWARAGVIRDGQGLEQALDELAALRERSRGAGAAGVQDLKRALRLESMLTGSEMVCRSALHREESRGAHFRQDHPERDDANWLVNVRISRDVDRMSFTTEPVKLTKLSP
jgi:succinate dehydrogenase / fumarate reductase flavoprotein subunit